MASEDFSFESSYFLSAPPSPCTTDPHHLSFYTAVPPSPNAKQNLGLEFPDDLDFQFTTGEGFVTASSFESPKKKRGLHRCAESLPSVSFADELFSDGKVKPLPPPPAGSRSPATGAASPRSPLSRRNSLWNDEFDPFVAALEAVKEDSHRRNTKNHRRVRSESPFDHHRQEEQQLAIVAPKSPVQEKLREPKGVDFSRQLRQVKILAGDYGGGGRGRKTKKQKMMRFLTIRSKSHEKEEEDRENNHGSVKSLMRRLSFNRSRSSSSSESEKKKTVAMAGSATRDESRAVTKVAIMQYRPRLLLCMGYGLRRSSS